MDLARCQVEEDRVVSAKVSDSSLQTIHSSSPSNPLFHDLVYAPISTTVSGVL